MGDATQRTGLKGTSVLLRNCSLDDLTGLAIDQYETKILCTLT